MKRVYVAGPYSGDNILTCLKNIGKGQDYAAEIFGMGLYPFCPWHDKDYVIRNWFNEFEVKDFYDFSMAWLEVSECVFLVPGWESSKGTLMEIERAKELGLPIFDDMDELYKFGHDE